MTSETRMTYNTVLLIIGFAFVGVFGVLQGFGMYVVFLLFAEVIELVLDYLIP